MGSSGQSLILSQSAPLPSPQFAPKQLPTSRPTFRPSLATARRSTGATPPLAPMPTPPKRPLDEGEDTQFDMEMDGMEMLPPPAQPRVQVPGPGVTGRGGLIGPGAGAPAAPPARSRSLSSGRASQSGKERADKKPRRSGSSTPLSTSPSTSLVVAPIEADLQPHAVTRSEDFKSGRRIFHVHFGHGYVASLETKDEPDTPGGVSQAEQVLSSRTQDINVVFDSPKYPQAMKLRAFYAVPKMVVIPSGSCLGKRKLQASVGKTVAATHLRTHLVTQMLAAGGLREAAGLVQRWQLQHAFEPSQLLQRMLQQKQFLAVIRFAREFGLTDQYPTKALLQRMLEERRYEGALKFVSSRCTSVDGQHSPVDVLTMLVGSGRSDVALKYVHKFNATSRFPPEQLVARILQAEGTLTVRTWALLLKHVRLFGLEETYPMPSLLERVTASGIAVHRMNGKYVLKGSRRASASGASPAGSTPASPAFGPKASPAFGPMQPARVGSAPN